MAVSKKTSAAKKNASAAPPADLRNEKNSIVNRRRSILAVLLFCLFAFALYLLSRNPSGDLGERLREDVLQESVPAGDPPDHAPEN